MDNKLFIGTIYHNNILHLTFSDNQAVLMRIFLVSSSEFVDEDLLKVSEQMKIPIHRPF